MDKRPPGLTRRPLLLGATAAMAWPGLLQAQAQASHRPGDALQARPLRFPRDHGSHNQTRTEWWYLTGHARDTEGRDFGFQLTFFRSRVDAARDLPSRLAARQLLFAHAAITDVRSGELVHDQRIARWNGDPPTDTARAVFASEHDTHVALRDWLLRRETGGEYLLHAQGPSLLIDLQATPRQALLLQGDRGFSRKGPDAAQASFYVSQPHLAVRGTLGVRGQRFTVQGSGWLDHEWSEALLHPDAVGWDWIGMNLFDGHSLTAFQLRRQDGSKLWAGGSFRSANSAQSPTDLYDFRPGEVDWSARRHWTSPLTRARYPVEWVVRTPADFYTVRAVIDPQELDSRASTGTVYWEGLSDLLDSNGRTVGRGYLEMTGYAQRLTL
ncbi:carotenoid 1,2-hydratase [Hydrogenophaga sp.]|uniref:lipocalin-like domain-containing protein n=1 Tax=Hydrogenophaga sp. TaxID=1904254 RepID=UPI002621D8E6|nr:carotenoid 1,2-hydratase [Hydrogenophaga sp.]MCW5655302.1 carotenoid 1,2-hydratase [Hydrogenophaga sp.]